MLLRYILKNASSSALYNFSANVWVVLILILTDALIFARFFILMVILEGYIQKLLTNDSIFSETISLT